MVTWNVSDRAIIEHPQIFLRTLAALRPDVVLLDEVTESSSAEEVQRFLAPLSGDPPKPWSVVFGRAGGYQRAVVASRHKVSPVEALDRLAYAPRERERLMRLTPPDRQAALQQSLDHGIGAVGAIVELDGRRMLMMPVDLQCCGNRTDSARDLRRQIEARTIRSAVKGVLGRQRLDAVVIGGDLNLVGSRKPLDVLLDGLDVDGSRLAVAEALQLDGLSNMTWSRSTDLFAPGRLDYVLYSDSSLQVGRAFVYNSRTLPPRWLRHHGLDAGDSSSASDHMPLVVDVRWKR
jgi:endonuclease/exonuclease/phosphatase family metal-dependent hydrolase